MIAQEGLLSSSHATQTVVQVRRPSCLKHKCYLRVYSFGINDPRSLKSFCIRGIKFPLIHSKLHCRIGVVFYNTVITLYVQLVSFQVINSVMCCFQLLTWKLYIVHLQIISDE